MTPRRVGPLRSLAVQVPVLLVIALSLVVSAGAWGLRTIVLRSFERLEIANAELDLRRFANAIDDEVGQLTVQLDQIVSGKAGGDFDPLPQPAEGAPATTAGIACIFDAAGALLSTDSRDPAGELFQQVHPAEFCGRLEGHASLAPVFSGRRVSGLYDAEGIPFFFTAMPTAEAGAIALAHYFSPRELAELTSRMEISIDFWSMQTPNLDILEAAAGAALSLGAPIIINRRSEDVLQVYWAFQDTAGEPAFLARANVFRDLREIGDETVLLSALSMAGVGVATIFLAVLLVRLLMISRLTRLTQRLLDIRDRGLGSLRVKAGRRDEIGVLAEEFDNLLQELAATTQQLADVSYRAGRAEVTEGSLHNIGNALNSLLASADAARKRLKTDSSGKIAQAARELAEAGNLTERQGKLAQYAALASEEEAERLKTLGADIERVLLHTSRIEDILESQRRQGADANLAVASEALPLINTAVRAFSDGLSRNISLQLDNSLMGLPRVICVRSIILQVFANLLANAAEAIARGGVDRGEIRISAAETDFDGTAMVDIRIADNGAGMEEVELVKIFQRYYTTKVGRGHGIGLHWCANVVTSMGAHLYAASPGPGQGATLHLLLPIAPKG
ncbi:HAMP domain-containing sensor histidine kinase [Pelagibius sp. CAU 1746]|uniref:HAMP domain-containing sensor histidine kinase n=1 Tax=Pelagibius sp. CAU 1746 TaxID=3140370 RepID=UPI00325C1F29